MRKMLIFAFALTLVLCFFTACTATKGETFEFDDRLCLTLPDGSSCYTVIHGENAEQWEINAAVEFRERFKSLTGCCLHISGDYKPEGIKARSEFEIRIGKTNRDPENNSIARKSLGKGGYIVRTTRFGISIEASDAAGMQHALDFFFDSVTETEKENKPVFSIPFSLKQIRFTQKDAAERKKYIPVNYQNMKCIWLSQFDMTDVYTENGSQRQEAEYTALLQNILDRILDMGFNTVFVQVRPYADSIYPSALYPMSACSVGSYGNNAAYDPFSILLKLAHEKDLSVHAWINPLRCMTVNEIEGVSADYAVGQWYRDPQKNGTYLRIYENRYYLNPAYSQVRELITEGALEIARNYPIDGIHMDDYFYPTTNEDFDSSAYAEYLSQNGSLSLGDFRRKQINLLVSGMYRAIKEISPDILFGISPAGSAEDTYQILFADVYTWCSESGFVDYICPQIYWGMEHQTRDFRSVCLKWKDMVQCDSVRLIIGMTLTKAVSGIDQYAGTGQNEWSDHKDIIKRCIEYTGTLDSCTGVALFSYQCCYDVLTGEEQKQSREERACFVPLLRSFSWTKA